ncbi:hypothetical protein ABZT17_26820 [Streptomyces sp. NPDC005648]|uniref:hypothetical protein n=1 Tax=Streptomyces sp. NPDC005648 TaxID=3157044 RepID=UPI0033A9CC92
MSSRTSEWTATAKERRALDEQLYTLVGRSVKEVRVTRVNWPKGYRWVTTFFGTNGREVPVFDRGLHHQAAVILREVFPRASWGRAQDYEVATGTLREHVVRLPSALREAKH